LILELGNMTIGRTRINQIFYRLRGKLKAN
jgi:hypothetical protein